MGVAVPPNSLSPEYTSARPPTEVFSPFVAAIEQMSADSDLDRMIEAAHQALYELRRITPTLDDLTFPLRGNLSRADLVFMIGRCFVFATYPNSDLNDPLLPSWLAPLGLAAEVQTEIAQQVAKHNSWGGLRPPGLQIGTDTLVAWSTEGRER